MRWWRGFAAAAVGMLGGLAAQADLGWALWSVTVSDEEEAQRLADSPLRLAQESVRIGANEVIVGPSDPPLVHTLGLPATPLWAIPAPTPVPRAGRESNDYRTTYLNLTNLLALYERWRSDSGGMMTRTRIGGSIQGRDLWMYRLSARRAPGMAAPKTLVITCGIHAREWISPSAGLYVADRIRVLSRTSRRHQLALSRVEVAIVPVQNPDGYEFTWTNDRYWRKNRRRNNSTSYGVDLNRNYASAWGGPGSSGNTSSDVYRGTAAFSEPETRAVRNAMATMPNVVGFIDFHSYGDYVLWPWGSTTTLCPDHATFAAHGQRMGNAIVSATGRNYTLGPTSQVLYLASGGSNDWAYQAHNALGYCIELRGGGTGLAGFVLPESLIASTQQEAWAAFERLWLDLAGVN